MPCSVAWWWLCRSGDNPAERGLVLSHIGHVCWSRHVPESDVRHIIKISIPQGCFRAKPRSSLSHGPLPSLPYTTPLHLLFDFMTTSLLDHRTLRMISLHLHLFDIDISSPSATSPTSSLLILTTSLIGRSSPCTFGYTRERQAISVTQLKGGRFTGRVWRNVNAFVIVIVHVIRP